MVVVGLDRDRAVARARRGSRRHRRRRAGPAPRAADRRAPAGGRGRRDRRGAGDERGRTGTRRRKHRPAGRRRPAAPPARPAVDRRIRLADLSDRLDGGLARGHTVTVLGPLEGRACPTAETDPAGYEIIRVTADPGEALPVPAATPAGWRRRLRGDRPNRPTVRAAHADGVVGAAGGGAMPPVPPPAGHRPPPAPPGGARCSRRVSRATSVRRGSILLTIRSHSRHARELAPAGGPHPRHGVHGHPGRAAIAERQPRAKVVYDARDIYMDAANLARMRGPVRWLIAPRGARWARRADRVDHREPAVCRRHGDRFGVPSRWW